MRAISELLEENTANTKRLSGVKPFSMGWGWVRMKSTKKVEQCRIRGRVGERGERGQ